MDLDNILDTDSDSSDEETEMREMLDLIVIVMNYRPREPQRTSILTGAAYINEQLEGNPANCHDMFRMYKGAFRSLCARLRELNYAEDTKLVTVEEAVGITLFILGHGVGMRVAADRFQHSLETVQRKFRQTIRAFSKLGKHIIRPTQTIGVHPFVSNSSKYYPWFKHAIGAIDGTHIKAHAPTSKM
ncbi:uncharacterized protein LOC133866274 [Alnus glutinosa]|uniref:uncharacterized protein LOC133866274 n=1 Tax=Alnus glutinosa TaxID=3517 RepID=UPI002D77507D|nr:uncharacterized protein LOC133866274 [Alnus glutinosa]